jgi:hypothetical protein
VLRAAGETESTQENVQDCVELLERDSAFRLPTEEDITVVMFYIYFYQL